MASPELAAELAGAGSDATAMYEPLLRLVRSMMRERREPASVFATALRAAWPADAAVAAVAAPALCDALYFVLCEYNAGAYDALVTGADDGMTVIERLHAFTQLVVGDELLVSASLAAQLLDAAQLVALGLAPSTAVFNKKVVRQNTKDSYTQRKYNLLREESEGFAKLFARLAEDGALGSPDAVLHTTRTVQSLIGYFDLDPNRVFDVALDALEQLPQLADMHRPLLALFKPSALSQVLGFKFQIYHDCVGTFAQATLVRHPSVTPPSLYRLAAQLVALGALDRSTSSTRICSRATMCSSASMTSGSSAHRPLSRALVSCSFADTAAAATTAVAAAGDAAATAAGAATTTGAAVAATQANVDPRAALEANQKAGSARRTARTAPT
jgi:hypothetical protein